MPSNKTFVTLIFCFTVVVCAWLIFKKPDNSELSVQNADSLSVRAYVNENPNDDWKKILGKVATSSQTVVDLTNSGDLDDTTITGQMSRDFLAQYLLLKKGNRTLTKEEMDQIIQNLLTSSENENGGAVYIVSNLHINPKTDKVTIQRYKETVNLSLKTRSSAIKESPVTILTSALELEKPEELEKLDPIITTAKGMIDDLLAITVPKSALEVHLGLINSISNILSDLESMRQSFTDPLRSMTSMEKYNQHILDFTTALKNIGIYFIEKTGSQ